MSFFSKPADAVGTSLNIHMFVPRNLVRHLRTLLRDPRYFYHRIAVMLDQAIHPRDPWLTRTAVDEVARYCNPAMRGFEWGSGRSTIWLAQRLQKLVSVEHHPEWHSNVVRMIADAGLTNVDYRLAQTGGGYVQQIDSFPDGYFDFILIDGEDRNGCIRAAASKIRVGGLVVVDNADSGYDFSPLSAFECRPTYNGVWRTDLFTRRS